MKKSQKKTARNNHHLNIKTYLVGLFAVLLLSMSATSLLLSWSAWNQANYANPSEYKRLVKDGMEAVYKTPVVSPTEKKTVIPELSLALPYDSAYADLRYTYSNTIDEGGSNYQEASLTLDRMIEASLISRDGYSFDKFTCNKLITLTTTQIESQQHLLVDSLTVNGNRTLYIYNPDVEDEQCAELFKQVTDKEIQEFIEYVKQADAYDI